MPDILSVFSRRWKFILALTIAAPAIAFVVTLIMPREYLSTATALPVNSAVADKARIFNNNIQSLYSDFGTPDELDRMEGTAALDTIYIAVSKDLNLAGHYLLGSSQESMYKAAVELKKNSTINRSAYGELKVKVWDKDRNLAATMANALLEKIQQMHQHLQNESNATVLEKLKEDYAKKIKAYNNDHVDGTDSSGITDPEIYRVKKLAMMEQLTNYQKTIDQYQVAISTNPQVLLVVEQARPSLWPDKPRILATVLITLFAAFAFSFLLAVFLESRKRTV